MKVRVTFEVTDTDRIAISVAQGNGFKPAAREDIVDFLENGAEHRLSELRDRFQLATEEIMGEVAL